MTATVDGSEAMEATPSASAEIVYQIAQSFTYASFQNAVPVIRSIGVNNPTSANIENCRLELTSNPPFLRSKIWQIDRILAGESIALSDRKIDLDARYLAGLNEAERGELTLRLSSNDKILAEQSIIVRLLARDEWGGVADMAQLLPAFVMPNDPATAAILREAASTLAAHGHSAALDGYQNGTPQRAYMLAAAIYSAVAAQSLLYAEPPASFESRGQKVRRPSTIVSSKLATCLDTALLFAAALEATGLNPIILLFQGHAAVGVWLVKKTLANAIEPDAMEIRKALASQELIIFESTCVSYRPVATFDAAQRAIHPRIDEEAISEFVAAIDVSRTRSGGITPLASHDPTTATDESDALLPVALPLPAMAPISSLPADVVEVKPTTAAGRIDRWQKKLLDLTLRNRLLNFPDTRKTIPFLCTDVGYLEDRLVDGAAIRLISLPEQNPLGERDATLFREVRGKDLQRGFAADALMRDELASPLDAREMEARLIDLYRQVKNDLSEGGANTLFLAVGFLRWKKKGEERTYRAPLLLLPVKLDRRSASSNFTLRYHEDETRFNATLLQFIEQDFGLELPQFSGNLPRDESGIDVPRVLSSMRHAVRDVPGMEVVDETALSTFSFAKFLMWKDLVERTESLRDNRLVRHLIDTPDKPFEGNGGPFVNENDIDRKYVPSDIVSLLPADSSQLAASLAAAEGHDFVIVGPPGTGKSQTIANMIAHCLAVGKTVLFVAEKTAALNVVYRRLRENGLDHCCLELHSNKADRRQFLAQLKKSWESAAPNDVSEWIAINERLHLRRDQLNSYVQALHKRHDNGLTAYRALGLALKYKELHAPNLTWPSHANHDEKTRQGFEAIAQEVGVAFQSVKFHPALRQIDVVDWTSSWQNELLKSAATLKEATQALCAVLDEFLVSIGLPPKGDTSIAELAALKNFAEWLSRSAGLQLTIVFDREFAQCASALAILNEAIREYSSARESLAAIYDDEALPRLPIDECELRWKQASTSIWPSSAIGKRKVQRLLQGYVLEGRASPESDLSPLRKMQKAERTAASSLLATKPVGFTGLDTDVDHVGQILLLGDELRHRLRDLRRNSEDIGTILKTIEPALHNGAKDEPVRQTAQAFLSAYAQFHEALAGFSALAGKTPALSAGATPLIDLIKSIEALTSAKQMLRDWTFYCRARRKAESQNLGALVEDIEAGLVPAPEAVSRLRLAYARWWLPTVLDHDLVLRDFRRFQHEHAISEFREIDDLVRSHASARVTSALANDLPTVQNVPRQSELGLLRHQMELQRPSRSIRDMISAMPTSFPKLAPCMLMSPLSIAQYLPHNQALFDVVIFDEASQITTWDAIGAIARGKQTIIVGDSKQLPPTNFFGRNDDETDEGVAEYETDLESILDEARASGVPVRDLRWHYRSRNESLIAFSNHHYYQNRLITFPSPSVEDRAVQLRKVSDGIYDRGKSRTNRREAEAVVAECVNRMRRWLSLDEKDRPTLAVITLNAQQQGLIQDLLDQERRAYPEIEWFFEEDRIEPTIVKNLENVQGDERDVVLFSITFSRDAAGKRMMDFGALNREGGERRLNVAVTRARQELIVFSGFTADQIDAARTKAVGIRDLKSFLDFAERGTIALPSISTIDRDEYESPFEEAVAAELEKLGWELIPQVGVSGFRIDIGVRHPDSRGAYLAGVECDGATYHRSASARDRDKVREQVLRGLGWNIVRVWSTDWWFDPDGCTKRLHDDLTALLERDRQKAADQESEARTVRWDMGQEVNPIKSPLTETHSSQETPSIENSPPPTAKSSNVDRVASPSVFPDDVAIAHAADEALPSDSDQLAGTHYCIADLSNFAAEPAQFYELSYRGTLQAMIDHVIEQESPVRQDVLAQRIARAHGWLRTGNRIRDRIQQHLREVERTQESSGTFVWRKGTITDFLEYRPPINDDSRRTIADIPIAELAHVVLKNKGLLGQADPALDLARLLGVERLASTSRLRLDEAIERAIEHLA